MTRIVFSRPRFFNGRLLTAQDLQTEQTYHRDKAKFLNLQLYGPGIVSGLRVGLSQDRSSIIVSPGYAIDPDGRDICVPCDTSIPIPPQSKGLSVWIRYAEAEGAPTPGLASLPETDNLSGNAKIEEGFDVDFASIPAGADGRQPILPPPPSERSDTWVLLGVLLRKRNTWRLKPSQQRSCRTSQQQRSARGNRTRT